MGTIPKKYSPTSRSKMLIIMRKTVSKLPSNRPAKEAMTPARRRVSRIPIEKFNDMKKAFLVEISFCSLINATTIGILARWQGLRRILNIPHKKLAPIAIPGLP